MILTHPDHKKSKRVSRSDHLTIIHLKSQGWKEKPIPERTPKQKAATERWRTSGQLARTLWNLRDVIRRERNSLNSEQHKILNRAEIVLQQLSKKYQST